MTEAERLSDEYVDGYIHNKSVDTFVKLAEAEKAHDEVAIKALAVAWNGYMKFFPDGDNCQVKLVNKDGGLGVDMPKRRKKKS